MSYRTLPCAPPPVAGHHTGTLFDPRVLVVGLTAAGAEEEEADEQYHATAHTVDGREVGVSVRLAPPPASSRVHVRMRMTEDEKKKVAATVVAAHGQLVLIHLAHKMYGTWFVYRAGHPSSCCWLRRLPHIASALGWPDKVVGIVSKQQGESEEEDFIIADLQVRYARAIGVPGEVAQLLRYCSTTDRWEYKPVTMPYQGDDLPPHVWITDSVCASSSSSQGSMLMYFVDLYRGMLCCDVAADDPELRFIRFPAEIEIFPAISNMTEARLLPKAYRTADVTPRNENGVIKFVDVDLGFPFFRRNKSAGFTVTVWALNRPNPKELVEWDKVAVLHVDDELWPLPGFKDSPFSRCVPRYPLLADANDEDDLLVHFVVQHDAFEDWILTVDMKRKQLLTSYHHRTTRCPAYIDAGGRRHDFF